MYFVIPKIFSVGLYKFRNNKLKTKIKWYNSQAENCCVKTVFTHMNVHVFDDASENYSYYRLSAHVASTVNHKFNSSPLKKCGLFSLDTVFVFHNC